MQLLHVSVEDLDAVEERTDLKGLDEGQQIISRGSNAVALHVNGGAHQRLSLLIFAAERRDVNGGSCS